MEIKDIPDMKPGECFQVLSNEGGIVKAPCVRKILAVGTKTVASTEFNDRGYHYKLKMENYLRSEKMKDGNIVHIFSK
ncbi:hypothetical protein pETSU_021 [Edwardsiella phage pEt-SU]|uniref:Uncharacterized protein n=1 Tax=Edwardsiella phage pEt-SU TaxID=2562142 RepID=A0A4D6DWD3_9CAUD|nr:hypothetical protein HOV39_gp021 [Edwardsiella phage pEt-SU]QBZ70602.1 hypothetical protein pETSU_021 [Edwardsiella phage pEt-SU]